MNNSTTFTNHTPDDKLIVNGCFKNFTALACSRDAVEAIVGFITILGCLVKIIKLHIARHELWNQYMIFYSAIVEICLLTINWMYLHQAALDLVAELLKLFQFLVVCRFYSEVASRMSKRENLYKLVFLPSLLIAMVYFICLIVVGVVKMKDNKYACAEPEWLLLSCSEAFVGIVFIVVGIYITRRINQLKTDPYYRRNLKTSLWGIIVSFELSTWISMSYDISMVIVGRRHECLGVFVDNQIAFTAGHIIIKFGKWLLPIWAMMIVFKPDSFQGSKPTTNGNDIDEQPPIVQRASVHDFKSEFRPRNKSFNYKHLRNPDTEEERQIIEAQQQRENGYFIQVKQKRKKRRSRGSRNFSEGSTSTGPDSSVSPQEALINSRKREFPNSN